MRIRRLVLAAYGSCRNVGIDIGDGLTVVLGANEAGKSTSLDALRDLLWGIPARSPRASGLSRAELRIDAVLESGGESRAVVRRSTGLFADDLVTAVEPWWNPANRLSAQWWQTRLGIDHPALRRGGDEVFSGTGDLADVIFAAREGRSAREVLTEIAEQADKLFKPDGRSKNVKLRAAAKEYQDALTDRDNRLTRADSVVEHRRIVGELAGRRRAAANDATDAALALKAVEEDCRVIGSVADLRRARNELTALDADGDRLSGAELAEYDEAATELQHAQDRITKLDNEIGATTRSIDELSVDDRLLDDRATFNRLHPDVKARIEELRRAKEEFEPAVIESAARLHQLLKSIGVTAADDLDAALDGARVRADHAAALDELADRIEDLEAKRNEARDRCDRALNELAAHNVTVQIGASAVPDSAAIDRLRRDLVAARGAETTAAKVLAEATGGVAEMLTGAHEPHAGATVAQADVREARSDRDTRWNTIRRSWVTGELPESGERVDMAAELDRRMGEADRIADDEAAERSLVAALDARAEAHIEGLEAARHKQQLAAGELQTAADRREHLDGDWAATWAGFGVAVAPDTDDGSTVAGLLGAVYAERATDLSAAEQIAEISATWSAAATQIGLPAVPTTAAWRKHLAVLGEIESVQQARASARDREAQARGSWDAFVTEAVELLRRHGALDEGPPVNPAVIEQGFGKLARQLDEATAAAAKRATYREQIDGMHAAREEARHACQDASAVLHRLAADHRVNPGQDLDVLAERARFAAEPLEREARSMAAIRNGLESGSDLATVVDRLDGHDRTTVEQALSEARVRDQEARQSADQTLSEYTSAHDRLVELQKTAGAADAEAAVVTRQAEVARLTETWAIMMLQRRLLQDVLDELGSDDTRPLLDHAGQLLDRLTDGRWVALRAETDGAARRLRVVRADNTPCEPAELSEGTADQVFFALRLAAVVELHNDRQAAGDIALPLVLDDVLMAFDETRVKSALGILASLAPGLQVIVFTHHEHVVEAVTDLAQVTVSRLPGAAPITEALSGELIRAQP